MKVLDAIEIIINDKSKKAVSKDYNHFIYWCNDTNTLCWNDGRYVTLTTSVLNSDWLIQDISEQEKEEFQIVKYINNYLDSAYESIDDIDVIDILESYKSNLSEEFIERLLPIVDDDDIWFDIFEYYKLSENFIRKYVKQYDNDIWSVISKYQTLSEDFIIEFKDKVDWCEISEYQKFSEEFALKFHNELDWSLIIRRKLFSLDFYIQNMNFLTNEELSDLLSDYPEFATMVRNSIKN